MGLLRVRVLPFVFLMGVSALAQGPTYGVGRTPTRRKSAPGTSPSVRPARNSRQGVEAPRRARRSIVEGVRGMPRCDGHRGHGAHLEK